MKKTFKNIIKEFELFSKKHSQINSFDWGNISDISTKDIDFVQLFLMPTRTRITDGVIQIFFDMYIFDKLKQDNSNLLDIYNNTLMIGNDVYDWFSSINDEFELDSEMTSEFFEGKFDDYTSGHVFNIKINIQKSGCSDNLPLK